MDTTSARGMKSLISGRSARRGKTELQRTNNLKGMICCFDHGVAGAGGECPLKESSKSVLANPR